MSSTQYFGIYDPALLWQSNGTKNGTTGVWDWSEPSLVSFPEGAIDPKVAELVVYSRPDPIDLPVTPSGGIFDLATGAYITLPTGWTKTIPDGPHPVYMSAGIATGRGQVPITWNVGTEMVKDGATGFSAANFRITNSNAVFSKDKAEVISPDIITLDTTFSNITDITNYIWEIGSTLVASGVSASSYNVPKSDYTNASTQTYTCTVYGKINGNATSLSDSITIPRLDSNTENPRILLSNENSTLTASSTTGDYTNITVGAADCTITVFLGATSVNYDGTGTEIPSFRFGTVVKTGCTGDITNNTIELSTIVADTATQEIPVIIKDNAGHETTTPVTVTYSLSRQGSDGRATNIIFAVSSATNSIPTLAAQGPSEPTGWDDSIGKTANSTQTSANPYLWYAKGKGTGETWEWGTPQLNTNTNASELRIYKLASNDIISSSTGQYDFSTGALTNLDSTWSRTIPSVVNNDDTIYVRTAIVTGAADSIETSISWSGSSVYAKKTDGTSIQGDRGAALTAYGDDLLAVTKLSVTAANAQSYFVSATGLTDYIIGDSVTITNTNTTSGWTYTYVRKTASATGWVADVAWTVNGDAIVDGTIKAISLDVDDIQTNVVKTTDLVADKITSGTLVSQDGTSASLDLTNGNINLGNGKLQFTSANSTFKVAAWTVDADAIFTGTKKTTDGFSSDGITINGTNSSIHAKNFQIKSDGTFESTGGVMTSGSIDNGSAFGVTSNGMLTANLGTIANWTLATDAIYTGTKTLTGFVDPAHSGMTLGSGIHTKNFYVDADGSAGFKGVLTAPSGNIGGWSLAGDILTSFDGKVKLDGANSSITVTGTVSTDNVIIDGSGIKGFNTTLGTETPAFDLPTDGRVPTFVNGVVENSTVEISTQGIIRTSDAALTGVKISNTGILGYDGTSEKFKLDATTGDLTIGGSASPKLSFEAATGTMEIAGALKSGSAHLTRTVDSIGLDMAGWGSGKTTTLQAKGAAVGEAIAGLQYGSLITNSARDSSNFETVANYSSLPTTGEQHMAYVTSDTNTCWTYNNGSWTQIATFDPQSVLFHVTTLTTLQLIPTLNKATSIIYKLDNTDEYYFDGTELVKMYIRTALIVQSDVADSVAFNCYATDIPGNYSSLLMRSGVTGIRAYVESDVTGDGIALLAIADGPGKAGEFRSDEIGITVTGTDRGITSSSSNGSAVHGYSYSTGGDKYESTGFFKNYSTVAAIGDRHVGHFEADGNLATGVYSYVANEDSIGIHTVTDSSTSKAILAESLLGTGITVDSGGLGLEVISGSVGSEITSTDLAINIVSEGAGIDVLSDDIGLNVVSGTTGVVSTGTLEAINCESDITSYATIGYVGSTKIGFPGTFNHDDDVIPITSLTGGTSSTVSAGDIIIVHQAVGGSSTITEPTTPTGFTLVDVNTSNDTYKAIGKISYRIATGTETSIVVPGGSAYISNSSNYIVMVFNGVDRFNPIDVLAPSKTTINSLTFKPNAITPLTPGSTVVTGGNAAYVSVNGLYSTTGLTSYVTSSSTAGTYEVASAFGYSTWSDEIGGLNWNSGTFTPSQFTYTGTNSTTASSVSFSIALKPSTGNFAGYINNTSVSNAGGALKTSSACLQSESTASLSSENTSTGYAGLFKSTDTSLKSISTGAGNAIEAMSDTGYGLYAESNSGAGTAGYFNGDVDVVGKLYVEKNTGNGALVGTCHNTNTDVADTYAHGFRGSTTANRGVGVIGNSLDAGFGYAGVYGTSAGNAPGVLGQSNGTGPGVVGIAGTGSYGLKTNDDVYIGGKLDVEGFKVRHFTFSSTSTGWKTITYSEAGFTLNHVFVTSGPNETANLAVNEYRPQVTSATTFTYYVAEVSATFLVVAYGV